MTQRPKVAIVNRVMPHYRLPVMEDLSRRLDGNLTLIYSRRIVSGKKTIESQVSPNIATRLMDFKPLPLPVLAERYTLGSHRDLRRTLAAEAPGVIVTEGESNLLNSLTVSRFCREQRIPMIWWGCGRVRNKPVTFARKLVAPLLRSLLQRAAAVIGYSSYACSYYRDTYGLPPDRMFVAPNSLHRSAVPSPSPADVGKVRAELGIPPDSPVILYVGALTSPKKPDMFLRIFAELKQTVPELHAILVGDGPMMQDLRSSAEQDKQFHITGEVVADVHNYFHAADAFVMPGLGGLALQQAMMCGKPVVCSVADGTELDLVKDGKNGHFIKPDEPVRTWTDKLAAILQDARLRENMGKESKRIIDSEFNSDIMIQRILAAIEYSVTNAR